MLTAVVDDAATVGFRADRRFVVLHATRQSAEIRNYQPDGRLKVLATLPGARQIACDDAGGRLVFFVDGNAVFEWPKGRDQWRPYSA